MARSATTVALILATACERPASDAETGRSRATLSDSALRATPGYVVDSILPPDVALRRFRVGIDSAPPTRLAGPSTRDQLVREFFSALERHDIPALQKLAITKAEFAYLVYPGSSNSHRPYYQPPEIAWLLLQTGSGGGLNRLLQRAADGKVRFVSYRCDEPTIDGDVRVIRNCTVVVRSPDGATMTRKLFGNVVERAGRYKLLGFDNDY